MQDFEGEKADPGGAELLYGLESGFLGCKSSGEMTLRRPSALAVFDFFL
jgi:hypothetical protein